MRTRLAGSCPAGRDSWYGPARVNLQVVALVVAAVALVCLVPAYLLGARNGRRSAAPRPDAEPSPTLARALSAAPRLAALGARANAREEILGRLVEEATDVLGGVSVRVVPGQAGNQPAIQRAMQENGVGELPVLA